jgi:hypothetical protein
MGPRLRAEGLPFVTFGGHCDIATCNTVVWSAASGNLISGSTSQYVDEMQARNCPVMMSTAYGTQKP